MSMKLDEILDSVKIPSDEEVEAVGLRFERRLRRRRYYRIVRRMTSVAAVILCGVMLAWWQMDDEEGEVVVQVGSECVEHAIVVPTLILSDGNRLDLKEENMDTTIRRTTIRITDRHIHYDTLPLVQEVVYNTLVIPAGFTYDVTLADGTEVVLNAGSRLKYPVEFVGEEREVELFGEAYFDVTKSEKPFVVSVGDSKIRVYGTEFNVKSFSQNMIETVLIKGAIGFKSPNLHEVQVVPGERITYNTVSENLELEKVDVRYATAWMNGVFKYRDRKLNLVLEDIAAWYGIEFDSQIDLSAIEVTMCLSKRTPIEEVIPFMELMTDVKFVKRGRYCVIKKEKIN